MKKKRGFITNTAVTALSLFFVLGTGASGNISNLKNNNISPKIAIEDVQDALEDYFDDNSGYPTAKNIEDFKSQMGDYFYDGFPKYSDGTDIIKNYTPVEDSKNKSVDNYVLELNDDKSTNNIDESKFKIDADSYADEFFQGNPSNALTLDSTKNEIGDFLDCLEMYYDDFDKYPSVESLSELEKEVNSDIGDEDDSMSIPTYKNGESIIASYIPDTKNGCDNFIITFNDNPETTIDESQYCADKDTDYIDLFEK